MMCNSSFPLSDLAFVAQFVNFQCLLTEPSLGMHLSWAGAGAKSENRWTTRALRAAAKSFKETLLIFTSDQDLNFYISSDFKTL